MRQFRNFNAGSLQEAAAFAREARANGQSIAFSGGGTDLLQQIKDGTEQPDVLINLRTVEGMDQVLEDQQGLAIGGQVRLAELAGNPLLATRYQALAEAAAAVGTPQIRNAGTLAGNLTQRPWCWYYRSGFPCYKAGGNQCFSVTGENQQHAIFGGGPSYIVHPSDTAPALVALGAEFDLVGPDGTRSVPGADFFSLPADNPRYENILAHDELLAAVRLPLATAGRRSAYYKVTDRAAWTHAVVSAAVVLDMEGDVCTGARIVLGGVAPVPWRLDAAAALLAGQRITPELAGRVAAAAVADAQPLAKNAYKIPMVSAVVERTLLGLVGA